MIEADCRAYTSKSINIDLITNIFSFEYKEEDNDKREHKNSLVPTECAGEEVIAIGIDKRANGREERSPKRTEQSVTAEAALYWGNYFF